MDCLSVILGLAVVVIPVAALIQRIHKGQGIGWQFIRFNAIATALPITALLALNDALTPAASAILAGALGYAFGRKDE